MNEDQPTEVEYGDDENAELVATKVEVVANGTVQDAPTEGGTLLWHPATKGIQTVPEDTVEDVWAPLGWLRATVNAEGEVHVLAEAIPAEGETDTAPSTEVPPKTTRRNPDRTPNTKE